MSAQKLSLLNKQNISDKFQKLISLNRGLVLSRSPIFIVLLFAVVVRFYKLGSLGVNKRELENIERILSFSDISSFIKGDASTGLYYFLQYLWGSLIGYSVFNMRVFSVIISILGIYVFYKFTEEWFSRRLAQIAAFLLSISSFHILMSRAISHEILYPVIILSALYFLTIAYRQKDRLYFIISGIFLGLSIYSSEITFALAAIFILAGAYFFYKNKKFLTSFILEKTVSIVVISVLAVPFFFFLATNGSAFFSNFTLSPVVLINNLYNFFSSLLYKTPFEIMYNIGNKRIFDPLILMTFIAGLAFAVYGVKRRKFYFLLIWLLGMSIMIAFLKDFSLANFIYIAPVVFILSALIQEYVFAKWFKTFPFNRLAGLTVIVGVGFFYAMSLSYNMEKVFLAWAKYPGRQDTYNIRPLKVDLEGEKAYLYNADISKKVASVVYGISDKESLTVLQSLDNIEKGEKTAIITSANSASEVRDFFKGNASKYLGENIVLYEGETK